MNKEQNNFIEAIVVYCMQHQEMYPILMQRLAQAFLDEAVKKQEAANEQCSQIESALFWLMEGTQNIKTKKVQNSWELAKNKMMPFIKDRKTFCEWFFISKDN
jgi:hypothetical protein